MGKIEIRDAVTGDERIIHDLAWATWWKAYGDIISDEQIRYMLELLYNEETLRRLIDQREQQFVLLCAGDRPEGFAAYAARPEDPTVYKLHKLYVHPDCQGKGYGRRLLDEITSRLVAQKVSVLDLNVNRENPAFEFYRSLGFTVLRQEDIPMGTYWMNDYVMRLHIALPAIA
jgi:ribosomal protein S18 acetylase RimI-like enzyme